MQPDETPKPNYFEHNSELTIDGTPYKKENYLLKSYVIGPLLLMTLLTVGSILLLSTIQ